MVLAECVCVSSVCAPQDLKQRDLRGIVVALAYFAVFPVFVLPEGSQATCVLRGIVAALA